MSSQTDVLSARAAATGSLVAARGRLKGIHWVAGATAGGLVFADGNGGTVLCTVDTPAGVTEAGYLLLPGEGIRFQVGIYVTVTNATAVTIFYA